jgi:hypothetical protein
MWPISDFFNTLLSLTHPPLYNATLMSLEKLSQIPAISPFATKWTSFFHGISVISNRITPPHIDLSGSWSCFDLLVSFGSYNKAILKLDDLGLSLDYSPGTVVEFSGNLLTHEVGSWDCGDRICYAYLIKKSIFDYLEISLPDWSYLDRVTKLLK